MVRSRSKESVEQKLGASVGTNGPFGEARNPCAEQVRGKLRSAS
jgi:hypothetical protein